MTPFCKKNKSHTLMMAYLCIVKKTWRFFCQVQKEEAGGKRKMEAFDEDDDSTQEELPQREAPVRDDAPPPLRNNDAEATSTDDPAMLRAEILRLREAFAATAQGAVEAKYLEELKKNRELNVRLEAEKSRVARLQAQLVAIEKEKQQKENETKKGILLPSQRGESVGKELFGTTNLAPAEKELNDVREKLDKANKTIATLRRTNEEMKHEVIKMKRVVATELGEEQAEKALQDDTASTTTADSSPALNAEAAGKALPGWRGRAQQIALLKAKIKSLEREKASNCGSTVCGTTVVGDPTDVGTNQVTSQIDTQTTRTGVTATTRRDFDDVNQANIQKREASVKQKAHDVSSAVEAANQRCEAEKQRADSVQARVTVLERDNQHLRMCIQRVVEKTENDDRLIAAYKTELDQKRTEVRRALTAKGSERGGTAGALEAEVARLQDTVADLRRELQRAQQPGNTEQSSRVDAFLKAIPDDGSALSMARSLIEDQRHTILSYEQRWHRQPALTANGAPIENLPSIVREENASLRERLEALSHLMDREIELNRMISTSSVSRQDSRAEPTDADIPMPPRHLQSASSSVPSSREVPSRPTEEFEKLKKQYDELRRAYNTQQAKIQATSSSK